MVRKIMCLLAVCLLLLPGAALAETRVFDEAGLFTAAEIQEMEAYIGEIRADYQVDVVVVTSRDVPYNRSLPYADNYYDEHGFGMGEDQAGLLFLIDMSNREETFVTEGAMADLITDRRLNTLMDLSQSDLTAGRYGRATMKVLRQVRAYLQQGREQGSFRYDRETGARLTGYYNPLTASEIMLAAGLGLLVAAIFVASVSGSYQLKGGTYRYNLADNVSRTLTRDEEHFVTQRVIRTPRQTSSGPRGGSHGGGSGSSGRGTAMHRAPSGHYHGGGSRKF